MNHLFEQTFVEQCAPTLAGIKPANLFRFRSENRNEINETISYWNEQLNTKGTYVRLLKECMETNSYLIIAYRKGWITKIFSQKDVKEFLKQNGYFFSNDCDSLLEQLASRLSMNQEFPHEVGLFLGYPLCDVIGFIKNKGKNFSCSGCWKAYEDPVSAKKYFETLRECTIAYKSMHENGIPLIELTVPASTEETHINLI
jgi:hypothetical protein